jgi:glutaredoxin 3
LPAGSLATTVWRALESRIAMAIVLYSTQGCPHCAAARQFLASRGVAFGERDPFRDRAALGRMIALTGRASVPTLAVGRDVMVGFDAARWSEMLDRG